VKIPPTVEGADFESAPAQKATHTQHRKKTTLANNMKNTQPIAKFMVSSVPANPSGLSPMHAHPTSSKGKDEKADLMKPAVWKTPWVASQMVSQSTYDKTPGSSSRYSVNDMNPPMFNQGSASDMARKVPTDLSSKGKDEASPRTYQQSSDNVKIPPTVGGADYTLVVSHADMRRAKRSQKLNTPTSTSATPSPPKCKSPMVSHNTYGKPPGPASGGTVKNFTRADDTTRNHKKSSNVKIPPTVEDADYTLVVSHADMRRAELSQKLNKPASTSATPSPPKYTHTNKATGEMMLLTQRKDSIDVLDAALAKIRQDGIGAKEVSAFMDKLKLFHTNTELGKVHLSLLFYPPTAALKSGYTLGNATGRELQKENVDMSVIECFPYAHIKKIKELRSGKVQNFI
jgi:hypothetical protein